MLKKIVTYFTIKNSDNIEWRQNSCSLIGTLKGLSASIKVIAPDPFRNNYMLIATK